VIKAEAKAVVAEPRLASQGTELSTQLVAQGDALKHAEAAAFDPKAGLCGNSTRVRSSKDGSPSQALATAACSAASSALAGLAVPCKPTQS